MLILNFTLEFIVTRRTFTNKFYLGTSTQPSLQLHAITKLITETLEQGGEYV